PGNPYIYTLTLHDALPISQSELNSIQLPSDQNPRIEVRIHADGLQMLRERFIVDGHVEAGHATHFRVTQRRDDRAQVVRLNPNRSEEHTSELQSPDHLVCR